jgi:DNA (cytosine-5)-methyltransferase 1
MPLVGLTGGFQLPSAEAKGSRRGHGVVPAFVTSLAPCKQLPCKPPSFLQMTSKLRLLDLFSGIGGFSYAAEKLVGGFETVAFVEREPFCQSILAKHWPTVPIHDDITTYEPRRHSADVVCGGFPCQDISLAGKQAGIKEGTRSGLFFELMRVVRMVEPRYVVLENVAAILNNGLDTVLGELAEAGFDAEWACIPASDLGACHQRDRWWLVAYASSKQSRCDLALSTSSRDYQGHEAAMGDRSTLRSQQRINWRTGNKSLSPDWRTYVSKPAIRRGDDGISGRVDRLKALGNAVVPQVAAIPLQRVRDLATHV